MAVRHVIENVKLLLPDGTTMDIGNVQYTEEDHYDRIEARPRMMWTVHEVRWISNRREIPREQASDR